MRHRPTFLALVLIAVVVIGVGFFSIFWPLIFWLGPWGLVGLLAVILGVLFTSVTRIFKPRT